MHSEFFDDPQERLEILVMGAAVRIKRGADKTRILADYNLTEEEYSEVFNKIFPNGLPDDI
ncbi:MAG: hypothetical protein IKB57_05140 [Bacteroidaceae bacterium]|nr:hypothetical protein [Bacteroidaceae bacterium]